LLTGRYNTAVLLLI